MRISFDFGGGGSEGLRGCSWFVNNSVYYLTRLYTQKYTFTGGLTPCLFFYSIHGFVNSFSIHFIEEEQEKQKRKKDTFLELRGRVWLLWKSLLPKGGAGLR